MAARLMTLFVRSNPSYPPHRSPRRASREQIAVLFEKLVESESFFKAIPCLPFPHVAENIVTETPIRSCESLESIETRARALDIAREISPRRDSRLSDPNGSANTR